jgi:hypothetical protein
MPAQPGKGLDCASIRFIWDCISVGMPPAKLIPDVLECEMGELSSRFARLKLAVVVLVLLNNIPNYKRSIL